MRRVRQEKSGGSGHFPEKFLRDLICNASWSLRAEELDESFSRLKPVCRDLGLATGSIDNLLINPDGRICIVACRLWHSVEALRTVAGEVLDFAEALAQVTYSEFEATAARAAKSESEDFLAWAVLGEDAPDDVKVAFRDAVTGALNQGAFLVLVVGEGIKAGLPEILDFGDRSSLRFQFGLVEIAIYQGDDGGPYYVQPRVLLATETDARRVFVVEKEGKLATKKISEPEKSATISEQEFYDKLGSCNEKYPDRVRKLLHAAEVAGCSPQLRRTFNIYVKGREHSVNLGQIYPNGTVYVGGAAACDDYIGSTIGLNFLERVVDLLPADRAVLKDSFTNRGAWYVRFDGRSEIPLDLLLEKESEWLDAMRKIANALQAEGESGG